MDDNQNEIRKYMSDRRTREKEEVDFQIGCTPSQDENDDKSYNKCKARESKTTKDEESDKRDDKSEDGDYKKDKGKEKEGKESGNKGASSSDKMKESASEVKENEGSKEKNAQSKNKETNKGKEGKENVKEKVSGPIKKSDSKPGKDSEKKTPKDDRKSIQKKKKSDQKEKDVAIKSDETIRSDKSDGKEDQGGDKKKKSSKKKKTVKEEDSDKREDDSSDRKQEKHDSAIKAATRKDFCADTDDEEDLTGKEKCANKRGDDDEEDSRGKDKGATKRRNDDDDKPRGRSSWERNVDDESYYKMRGCDRRQKGDDHQRQDVSYSNFGSKDGRESRGCFVGELSSGGKKASYREVRISGVDCSKREKDGRRDVCSKGGRKDQCSFLTEGKRDFWRELPEKKRDTCKLCRKEERTDRDGICMRGCEERRERQRKPESRGAAGGCGRGQYRDDREGWKNTYRDDKKDWYRDDRYGKRDLHRDGGSSSAECDGRRDGSVNERGERREGRGGMREESSCPRVENDRRETGRREGGEEKTGRTRRVENQWTKDEIYRLKDELITLQTELEQMKSCLKVAVSLAERNKCTMTKLKEHLQCNLPDFAKIREKLRECQLLRLSLCGESTTNKTNWKKDFEFLICELNSVKCELENVKKEKR